jgi:hypothetical protein
VPLSNATNITREIAPVNRQNSGIVKIWPAVADSSRIRATGDLQQSKGDATNAICSRSSPIEASHFPFPKVFAAKKTGHFEHKTTLLAATRRQFRNLLSISFVAPAV